MCIGDLNHVKVRGVSYRSAPKSVLLHYKVSSCINFIADPRGDKKINITFTGWLNKQTTDQYSLVNQRRVEGVLHVARSAVAMTAHTVKDCVVVPNICFNRYFIVQNGADREISCV